jgi:FkbM family methyltransferase
MNAPFGKTSYSQFGEDMLISELLRAPTGFYVDAGAHDPWRYSNTALLHARGWRGMNIDADDRAIARFNAARPGDINIHSGVGNTAGLLEFARFADGAINSFDAAMVARQGNAFGEAEIVSVAVETLTTLLDRHKPDGTEIDFLNIDCEGLDFQVLQGLDWQRFAPKVIAVEVHGMRLDHAAANPTVQFLSERRYLFRGHYFATSIFHHLSAL